MKTGDALLYTLVMGAVIFCCRAFPFLFFRNRRENTGRRAAFLDFVEQTVPPAAMTVLAVNAITAPIAVRPAGAFPILAASACTALIHLWRRNPLVSICGGTAIYLLLERIGGS